MAGPARSQPRRRGGWLQRRPLLVYAFVGPAIAWVGAMGLILLGFDESSQAPLSTMTLVALAATYAFGAPVLLFTGWLSLRARQRGVRAYVLAAGSIGVALGTAAVLALMEATSERAGDPFIPTLTAITGGSAVCGIPALVCALLTAKRPPDPLQDLAAVFD
jgi:hypothetical protein